jgi:hypothetical protein
MYTAALLLHSWIRWVVIVLGAVAVWQAAAAASERRWSPSDDRAGMLFTLALDVQMLIGLLLFFWLSPTIPAAMENASAAMRQPQLRFWLVEHPTGMLAALILVHVGRVRTRRVPDAVKGRRARLFFGLALLLILAAIPWPGLPYGRGLIRW